MSIKSVLRTLMTLVILATSCGAVLAQELGQTTRPTFSLTNTNISRGNVTQLFVDGTSLANGGLQTYTPPPNACACTNLGGVTVICEDCDRETDVNLCHTHDRACQDAAQMGGIREHNTFFCTTLAE